MSDRTKSCTVFVGGISWKADEDSLKEFFSTYGHVIECKIIVDRDTNKSKGYGFVTFKDAETAEIVKKATDLNFLGKSMNVSNAYRKNSPVTKTNSAPATSNGTPAYVNYPAQWQFAPYPMPGYPPPPGGFAPPMPYGYGDHVQYYPPNYYEQYQYWQMMNAGAMGIPGYYELHGAQEGGSVGENASDSDSDVNVSRRTARQQI
mmetsp:Transcript_11699/g.14562  ORF Transcript_11699/g.14562 Transcript_11699/m.14562 type:complete len:204 (-) Transcript_11699:151-762(-)